MLTSPSGWLFRMRLLFKSTVKAAKAGVNVYYRRKMGRCAKFDQFSKRSSYRRSSQSRRDGVASQRHYMTRTLQHGQPLIPETTYEQMTMRLQGRCWPCCGKPTRGPSNETWHIQAQNPTASRGPQRVMERNTAS